MQDSSARAWGMLLGFAADRALADPRRAHPVAGFGRAAMALERVLYRDSRASGALYTTLLVGGTVLAGWGAQRAAKGPATQVVLTAAATWVALGGTSLRRVGTQMAEHVEVGDIERARALLPSLCGRDPSVLDQQGLARAAVESVAENTSDAAIAPLVWAAVAGVPGVLGYRAANTLDSMVGYRSPRYERFGWASARLDDVANYVPARVCGLLTVVVAPVVGGSSQQAVRAWRRDAAAHPSPNAGVAEATAAGALGVQLGGRTQYPHGVELRPTLGDGPVPEVADLRRATRLSGAVQVAVAVVLAGVAVSVGEFRAHHVLGRSRRR